jgi:hypothetical protein
VLTLGNTHTPSLTTYIAFDVIVKHHGDTLIYLKRNRTKEYVEALIRGLDIICIFEGNQRPLWGDEHVLENWSSPVGPVEKWRHPPLNTPAPSSMFKNCKAVFDSGCDWYAGLWTKLGGSIVEQLDNDDDGGGDDDALVSYLFLDDEATDSDVVGFVKEMFYDSDKKMEFAVRLDDEVVARESTVRIMRRGWIVESVCVGEMHDVRPFLCACLIEA